MYVFVTGFMASGKTKNGRIAAQSLGWAFRDLDQLIEQEQGATINEVFERLGEAGFRRLELDTLQRHTRSDDQRVVFSLGGGSYTDPTIRQHCRQKGITVFLDTPVGILYRRLLRKKQTRPLLRDLDAGPLLQTILRLHRQRLDDYHKADVVLSNYTGTARDRLLLRRVIGQVAP